MPTWTGFSWPCLLFGVLWFAYKGMYLWALGAMAAAVFTGGLAWLAFPFFANKAHRDWLASKGYVVNDGPTAVQTRCPECRELIRSDARKCKHCGSVVATAA